MLGIIQQYSQNPTFIRINQNKKIIAISVVALATISLAICGFCKIGCLAHWSPATSSATLIIGMMLGLTAIALKQRQNPQIDEQGPQIDRLTTVLRIPYASKKKDASQERARNKLFFEIFLLPYLNFKDLNALRSVNHEYQLLLPEAYLLFSPVKEIFQEMAVLDLRRFRLPDESFSSFSEIRRTIEKLDFSNYPDLFRLQYQAFNTIHEVVILKYTLFLPKEAHIKPFEAKDRVWHDYCVIENSRSGPHVFDMRIQLSTSSDISVEREEMRQFPNYLYCKAFGTTCFGDSKFGGSLVLRDESTNETLQSSVSQLITHGTLGFFGKVYKSRIPFLFEGPSGGVHDCYRLFDDIPVVLGHLPLEHFEDNFFRPLPRPHFLPNASTGQLERQHSRRQAEVYTFDIG